MVRLRVGNPCVYEAELAQQRDAPVEVCEESEHVRHGFEDEHVAAVEVSCCLGVDLAVDLEEGDGEGGLGPGLAEGVGALEGVAWFGDCEDGQC